MKKVEMKGTENPGCVCLNMRQEPGKQGELLMKRAVEKIRRMVCCLLVGLLLSEQIVSVVHAEETVGSETVSGNEAAPDSAAGADGEQAVEPYADESREADTFTEGFLAYRISDADARKAVCTGLSASYDGSTLTIPGTVEHDGVSYSVWRIDNLAFRTGMDLSNVVIEEGVTEIGGSAFKDQEQLKSVSLPDGLLTIGAGAFYDCPAMESINIPSSVTEIGMEAFCMCRCPLADLKIPEGITIIKRAAFMACNSPHIFLPDSLVTIEDTAFSDCAFESISLPEGVTTIGQGAFSKCNNLRSLEIPAGVTDIPMSMAMECANLERVVLPEGIKTISASAFADCVSLKEINIPETVTEIGGTAFRGCGVLEELKLWDTVKLRGAWAFADCKSFTTLKIVVTRKAPLMIASGAQDIFSGCPADRRLVFVDEDGKELTGDALAAAQNAYREDRSDGDITDNLWYGWKISDAPISAYSVNIGVNKDDQPWADSGKTFCLSKDGGSTYITDLTIVGNGIYDIYEVTGTADSVMAGSCRDTGVNVTVQDGNAEATVDYYTVTFYDGDVAYGADTQQHPQIVLKDGKADRPAADPEKAGFVFKEWVTAKEGNIPFDFAGTGITAAISVYAGWTENAVPVYQITATTNEGGQISPEGIVNVSENADQTFVMTPRKGFEIEKVLVDGQSQGSISSYTFTNVTADHTISIFFRKVEESGGTEKPGENEGGNGGPEKPGENEGGNGGPEKPGENEGGNGGTGIPEENADETGESNQPEKSEDSNGTEYNGNIGAGSAGVTASPDVSASNEPKTGDAFRTEIYATAAMIAGLLYLLLCFAEKKGLTETRKEEMISSIIAWAKEGGKCRRYAAVAAIFFVLAYYHSIGKNITMEAKCTV